AIREIAKWAYILETRDVAGGYTRANSKGYLVEKSTGNRYPVFTGENFNGRNETIIKTTVDYGTFLNSKIENDNRRELAGLLANMAHESGGGWDSQPLDEQTKWGFFYNEEVDVVLAGGYSDAYTSHESVDFPPVPGQSYHGRGGIQLSWNYNYGPFSIVAFGDKNVLLQNPGRVAKEGKLGWMSGIWFWMTPDLPKASCHDVIQSTWKPEGIFASAAGKGITWGFGATIIVINGGKESGGGEKPRRVNHYKDLAEKTGANIGGENITTAGMSPWT
ncbi:MAG: chitinase, partial [Treponema sp.]|nr:chitinase [Treponema sp.]